MEPVYDEILISMKKNHALEKRITIKLCNFAITGLADPKKNRNFTI